MSIWKPLTQLTNCWKSKKKFHSYRTFLTWLVLLMESIKFRSNQVIWVHIIVTTRVLIALFSWQWLVISWQWLISIPVCRCCFEWRELWRRSSGTKSDEKALEKNTLNLPKPKSLLLIQMTPFTFKLEMTLSRWQHT